MSVDVAVIGGGPAGAAVAATLRRYSAHGVAVFEASPLNAPRLGETLPASAAPLLHYLGVWDGFVASDPLPYFDVFGDWGSPAGPASSGHGGGGWRLPRPAFDRLMLDHIAAAGGEVFLESRVDDVRYDAASERWRIRVASGGTARDVQARYLVDASGSAAGLTRRLGASFVSDDALYAVVARYAGAAHRETSLLLEPSAIGWWYAIALRAETIVVLVTDLTGMKASTPAAPARWNALVTETRFVNEAARGDLVDLRARFIPSRRTTPVCGHRWIAVGDAAMSADPLSSLGIGYALSSGIAAARAIASEFAGDCGLLDAYAPSSAAIYDGYLRTRDAFYASETRWAAEPFWVTRRSLRARRRLVDSF